MNKCPKLRAKTSTLMVSPTDCGVLLLELAHNGRVVLFAGHEQPENLLPVFGHNEL